MLTCHKILRATTKVDPARVRSTCARLACALVLATTLLANDLLEAPQSHAEPFTPEEIAFIHDAHANSVASAAGNQDLVDVGWSMIYDLQHGMEPGAAKLKVLDSAHGLSFQQVRNLFDAAVRDLGDGSLPSPGRFYGQISPLPYLGY
jgi:hypothetical protein